MLFGHGSWNTFPPTPNKCLGIGRECHNQESELCSSSAQIRADSIISNLASASFANQYEPTGKSLTYPMDNLVMLKFPNGPIGKQMTQTQENQGVVVPAFLGGSTPDLESKPSLRKMPFPHGENGAVQ